MEEESIELRLPGDVEEFMQENMPSAWRTLGGAENGDS